jgi:P4 family phage/plasmid primase-like protien
MTTTTLTKLSPEQQEEIRFWIKLRIPLLVHDSNSKECHVSGWSTINLDNEDFEANMQKGLYDNGVSVRSGPTLSNCKSKYLLAIDTDGKDASYAWYGTNDLEEMKQLADQRRIEWHDDNPYRFHDFRLINEPITSSIIKVGDSNIEIRCVSASLTEQRGSLILISPSIHQNGRPMVRLGSATQIEAADTPIKLMQLKSEIECLKFIYTSDSEKSEYLRMCEDPEYLATLGIKDGRHPAMKCVAIAYFYRDHSPEWRNISDNERKRRLEEWNQKLKVPKTQRQVDDMWNWVIQFHKENRDKKHAENKIKRAQDKERQEKEQSDFLSKLIEKYHFKTARDNEEIYYYDPRTGIFLPDGDILIKEELQNALGRRLKNKAVAEALGQIQRSTYFDRSEFNHDINWIATRNCMINIYTGQTRAFNPSFMCTTNIPVVYKKELDPLARHRSRTSKIMEFFHDIMNDQDVELFLRFLAYCLVRDYRYNLWLILNGTGQNGKSILIQLIERFLGKSNVSGETLDRLLHREFAIAQLYERLVNVDADVSAKMVFDNTGIIKKLTGNDLHTAELKYKKPWPFRNYAKLIFSCNKIPETEDLTDAFFRRLIIINFTTQFWAERDDPHIIDKISTEEEFSMLFNELLVRLPDVIDNGVRKVTTKVLEENYTKFMRSADSVRIFVKEAIEHVPKEEVKPEDAIIRYELYDWYLKYCNENAITPESDMSVKEKLEKDHAFKLQHTKRHQIQGYYWIGIKKRDWTQYRKEKEKETVEGLVKQNYLSQETLDDLT